MSSNVKMSGRLKSLDALRGVAAIAVAVFSHYKHFGGDATTYPWAKTTWADWLYNYSWLAVDFFFLLSGIVITFRYLEPAADKRIDGREFFWLRVSRLYPLHLLTLCICAAVEWTLMAQHKPTVIYDSNDLYHFVLNLFYLHDGWFEYKWSYNAPSWSVVAEVFVYFTFFFFASKLSRAKFIGANIGMVLLGLTVQRADWQFPLLNTVMARAMVGFPLGTLIYLGIRECEAAGTARKLGYACLAGFAAVMTLAWLIGYATFIGKSPLPHVLAVFPLLIVAVLNVPLLGKLFSVRPLTFLGDISYAVYLVHVPVQMVMLVVLRERNVTPPVESVRFFALFAALVLACGYGVHKLVELPARAFVRGRFAERGAEKPAIGVDNASGDR